MGSLDQLYQQVILDHYKEKHGFGMREPAGGLLLAQSHQVNPLCGDQVTLRVAVERTVDADGTRDVVRDVSWIGDGCAISQASTSTLYDLVVDATAGEADSVIDAFRTMVRSRGGVEPDEELLGDAAAFAGVGRHANRVKCAMLGWTAFEDALHRATAEPGADAAPGSTSEETTG